VRRDGGPARACLPVLLALGPALGACRSLPVTPRAIEACAASSEEKERALRSWREAVEIANAFLVSPFDRTLPAGRFELGPDGMRLLAGDRVWPIEVRSTTWGDLVLWAGFQAQEASYGFCVGECPPEEEPLLHNSFFRAPNGFLLAPDSIADLILHETAHVVAREGTVGFWNSLAYYAEAIFLLRSTTHSDEDVPHAVDEEFGHFLTARGGDPARREKALRTLEEHLRSPGPHCRHGPVDPSPAPSRPSGRSRVETTGAARRSGHASIHDFGGLRRNSSRGIPPAPTRRIRRGRKVLANASSPGRVSFRLPLFTSIAVTVLPARSTKSTS
jgi:hypothetical protein